MKKILLFILLLITIDSFSQDTTKIKPLKVGDKVPDIPFNILDFKTGKTRVIWLYEIMEGKLDSLMAIPDSIFNRRKRRT